MHCADCVLSVYVLQTGLRIHWVDLRGMTETCFSSHACQYVFTTVHAPRVSQTLQRVCPVWIPKTKSVHVDARGVTLNPKWSHTPQVWISSHWGCRQ